MPKTEALERIKKLVEKYNNLSEIEKKKYNEQQTKDHFIRPLFEALGWNFEEDVWPETDVSGKRVDYAFKINGVTKFYVEAKPISINLDEERWAEQAISYSWHKSVPWVILTDFEAIKVFNTEWDLPDIQSCRFIELSSKQYIDSEKLWWLSRKAFEEGVLDREAAELGRRPKRVIDHQLADDLIRWRDKLYKSLKAYNQQITDSRKILEIVQKILNRLIFIRTLEDRGIEDKFLQPAVRNWEEKKGPRVNLLLKELNKIFTKIGGDYDSELFSDNFDLGGLLQADDGDFVDVVKEMYKTKNKGIRYNFDDIPSDMFGSIYEQYLGHIQKEEKKDKDKTNKRKFQGIYYTPRHVVDYIVKNALGEALKNKKVNAIDIKVLDPACGSGSFLIAAYQELIDYRRKEKEGESRFKDKKTKMAALEKAFKKKDGATELSPEEIERILLNNIHGVDLDKEAAELARLNLLLKMVRRRRLLPNLTTNIQNGNSLVSDNENNLKRYFGEQWKDKKPFNWPEKFLAVFKNGGFDVIIGNPPYIQSRNLNDEERHFYWDNYLTDTNHSDIYSFFVEKSIDLLKNGGLLCFIIPDTWLQIPSFKSLRSKIFKDCLVKNVLFFDEKLRVFEDAQVSNVVVLFQKEKNKEAIKNNKIKIIKCLSENSFVEYNNLLQSSVDFEKGFNIFGTQNQLKLSEKITSKSIALSKVVKIIGGLRTGNDNKFLKKRSDSRDDRKLLRGRNVERYFLSWSGEYVWYEPDLMKVKQAAAPKEAKIFEAEEKLLIRMITGSQMIATYDNEGFYFLQDNLLLPSSDYNLKYILALLNSKLTNFVVQNLTSNIAITQSLLRDFPIYKINFSDKNEKVKHDELVLLVDKMLELNKGLRKLDPVLDGEEYKDKQAEIAKADKKIDEDIYKLYGLTEEEMKVVEESKK